MGKLYLPGKGIERRAGQLPQKPPSKMRDYRLSIFLKC